MQGGGWEGGGGGRGGEGGVIGYFSDADDARTMNSTLTMMVHFSALFLACIPLNRESCL